VGTASGGSRARGCHGNSLLSSHNPLPSEVGTEPRLGTLTQPPLGVHSWGAQGGQSCSGRGSRRSGHDAGHCMALGARDGGGTPCPQADVTEQPPSPSCPKRHQHLAPPHCGRARRSPHATPCSSQLPPPSPPRSPQNSFPLD